MVWQNNLPHFGKCWAGSPSYAVRRSSKTPSSQFAARSPLQLQVPVGSWLWCHDGRVLPWLHGTQMGFAGCPIYLLSQVWSTHAQSLPREREGIWLGIQCTENKSTAFNFFYIIRLIFLRTTESQVRLLNAIQKCQGMGFSFLHFFFLVRNNLWGVLENAHWKMEILMVISVGFILLISICASFLQTI